MLELKVVDAIKEANENFASCMRRGDARALARLYSEDAMLLPPGSDFVEGREEIQTFWRNVMDVGISDVELDTLELHDFGGMALEIGTYKLHAGRAAVNAGKYVVVWRQEDLCWRLYRDTWNTSAVTAKATAA
jgi:uncharacterized protein (TIGR02246 family)